MNKKPGVAKEARPGCGRLSLAEFIERPQAGANRRCGRSISSPSEPAPPRPAPRRSPPRPGARARIGTRRMTRSPNHTTGALASIMPSVVPATTARPGLVVRRQHHGGDLRLVAHLGQEERDHRGAEHAQARRLVRTLSSSSLSGISIHTAMAMKEPPSTQRSTCGPEHRGDPGAGRAGQRVVGQGGDEDAQRRSARACENARPARSESSCVLSPISARATMPVETRKASMKECSRPERAHIDCTASPAKTEAAQSKVSPSPEIACAMDVESKSVDAGPSRS